MKNKLTLNDIEDAIIAQQFLQPEGTVLTICVLTLENGFNVVGHSACIDPVNFDAEIGRRVARQRAVDQVWALEGYRLKQALHEARGRGEWQDWSGGSPYPFSGHSLVEVEFRNGYRRISRADELRWDIQGAPDDIARFRGV